MVNRAIIHLDITQEFNRPKRSRCNKCGRFISRGTLNYAEHYMEYHLETMEYKPIDKVEMIKFLDGL